MIRRLLSIFKDSTDSFEGQENGERVTLLLRKHPFIIAVRMCLVGLAAFVPIIFGVIFWPYILEQGWTELFWFATSIWILFVWLAVFVSLTIYTLNTIIITDHRIIENDQHGLFNREVSALHSHRVQDVSAHTNGIIETFLKFGTVTVQTAAAEKQFIFRQIPKPDNVRDIIMQTAGSNLSGVRPIL